ncbi:exodeoxyribonuclease VII large subunit [Celeribacter marinus]|uniref:exodeoxyribonuclease VII large subunit n=1 Tax=Celeribacter marinus TaxID=1397108 RepID=UPI003173A925
MSELFEDDGPEPQSNAPEFTVGELAGSIKKTLEGAFGRVRVRGEIGRVMHARSGHLYYDLKDDKDVIACNTWKGQAARLSVIPEEGMEVIVTGRLSTFGPQSKYNLNVDEVEVAGEGALMAMLEKRKKALAAEGLFDPARKRPIPYLPEVIGVVTSPSGAVIRDILHRLRDRFPRHVLLWPVAVQGQSCAAEVAAGIKGFNALPVGGAIPRPDLIIVARGGGSTEDLWGFNEEIVARAAAASDIALISAVGHETDTTLIDYASDMRAPTPTAAAEMAVPVRRELWVTLQEMGARNERSLLGGLERRRQRLSDLARAMPKITHLLDGPRQRVDQADARLGQALKNGVHKRTLDLSRLSGRLQPATLRGRVERQSDRLNDLTRRFERAGKANLDAWRNTLERRGAMLEALSHRATMARGFALVFDARGALIKSTVDAARMAEVQFADGRVAIGAGAPVDPTAVQVKPPKGDKPKPKKAKDRDPSDQGSLF